ncbi:endophilin-B1-like isoform X1 [Osmerus mordax]|uniref:endophilin-B1-like isoform X1 n=1 Tax=Osmerus mordax TaxID=8014 RepID=UPI00350F7EAF
MDFTRLAVDAGAFINRAVQYTEETLGQAEKTELDGSLEDLLAKADVIKTRTDQIISQTEVLLQPNPGARMENLLYEHLDWSAPPRPCPHEVLGETMSQAGLELGSNAPYGTALLKCGEAQRQFGSAERKFIQSTAIHFLSPLRSYTEGEYRDIQNERKLLVNKRLDLDIAKTRLRKAHEADREARNLNANPLGDDYVVYASYMFSFLRVKWLKMWAQEISQAEMELRICQSLFDRQAEVTKRLLEGISNTHANHNRSLCDFVEAQASCYAQCDQHAQELQRQMSSIPAVFCSNNWQSAPNQSLAINHGNGQPIAANQTANLTAIEVTSLLLDMNQAASQTPNNPPASIPAQWATATTNQVTSQLLSTNQPLATKPETNQTSNEPLTTDQASNQSPLVNGEVNQSGVE